MPTENSSEKEEFKEQQTQKTENKKIENKDTTTDDDTLKETNNPNDVHKAFAFDIQNLANISDETINEKVIDLQNYEPKINYDSYDSNDLEVVYASIDKTIEQKRRDIKKINKQLRLEAEGKDLSYSDTYDEIESQELGRNTSEINETQDVFLINEQNTNIDTNKYQKNIDKFNLIKRDRRIERDENKGKKNKNVEIRFVSNQNQEIGDSPNNAIFHDCVNCIDNDIYLTNEKSPEFNSSPISPNETKFNFFNNVAKINDCKKKTIPLTGDETDAIETNEALKLEFNNIVKISENNKDMIPLVGDDDMDFDNRESFTFETFVSKTKMLTDLEKILNLKFIDQLTGEINKNLDTELTEYPLSLESTSQKSTNKSKTDKNEKKATVNELINYYEDINKKE